MHLPSKIKQAVTTWRKDGYPGVTEVTRRLLKYWFKEEHLWDDGTPFEFWTCQREAIETIIYTNEVCGYQSLYEISKGFDVNIEFDPTLDQWPRYCFHMATGSGKTFVMGLVLLWQYFNSTLGGEKTKTYANHFLLIAPNLIVLDRLREFEDSFLFHEWPFFIPPEWASEFDLQTVVQTADTPQHSRSVLYITNVQQLYDHNKEEGGYNPVQEVLGPEPVSGEEMKSRNTLYDIIGRHDKLLILNDEAHHAHPDTEWWKGMAKFNQRVGEPESEGLAMQVDFSATPMDADGNLFPHIIYHYSLNEAIDDEIVKRPRIGTIEGAPEPLGDDFVESNQIEIETGLEVHENKKEDLEDVGKKPVLFIMCDRNEHADEVGRYLSNEKGYGDRVLVIHTYKRKTRTGFLAGDVRKEDLDKAREAAQNIDDNKYEIIVSVMMLNEGWDVRNVTTIVPLRAYESEILVEQTLGRGLRRMFPEKEDLEERLVVVEHPRFRELWSAKVEERGLEGIEITTISDAEDSSNKVVVDESKLTYDFSIPLIGGGLTTTTPNLDELDPESLPKDLFEYDEVEVPEPRYIEKDLMTKEVTEDREIKFAFTDRHDEYLTHITKAVLRRVGSRSQFAELVPYIKRYIENYLFDITVDINDSEVIQKLNYLPVRKELRDTFVIALHELATLERPYHISEKYKLSDSEPTHTSLPVYDAEKSVFNSLPYDSEYEHIFMRYMDNQEEVLAYSKILVQMPLHIPYYGKSGTLRHYRPDFVVQINGSYFYLIETKGTGYGQMESVKLKDEAGKNWCQRVTKMTDEKWRYIKLMGEDFREYKAHGFSELVNIVAPT